MRSGFDAPGPLQEVSDFPQRPERQENYIGDFPAGGRCCWGRQLQPGAPWRGPMFGSAQKALVRREWGAFPSLRVLNICSTTLVLLTRYNVAASFIGK